MCEFCASEFHLSNMKWGTGEYGTPGGDVYWSFATSPGDGFGFSDYITNGTYRDVVRDAFQAWEDVADINFVEVADGAQTQMSLGWDTIDGSFGVVGEARTAGSRSTDTLFSMTEAEIRFDVSENWSTGTAGNNEVGFYQVALHEIGHAIGLNHSTDPNTIMYASNISGIPDLTASDIAGAQAIYGEAQSTTPAPAPEPEPDPVPEPDPEPTPDPDPVPVPDPPSTPGDPSAPIFGPITPVDPDPEPEPEPEPEPLVPLVGTAGGDIFAARAGDEVIDGGGGTDTLTLSGARSDYTLTLSAEGSIVLTDRGGRDGSDTLISIERLDFQSSPSVSSGTSSDTALDLRALDGVTTLSEDDFAQIVELYIAYFNRAPDAVGLAFWGNAFAEGLSIEDMATLFIDQAETREAYPEALTNSAFAMTVYTNVLGRVPDADGFAFWVDLLNQGAVDRDTFILSVLEGTKADAPVGASADFIDQVLTDRQYLSDKADLGAYFAVHLGMSDVNDASNAMALFDGSAGSIQMALNAIDNDYEEARDANNGDFLLPLLGVLDNPFV